MVLDQLRNVGDSLGCKIPEMLTTIMIAISNCNVL